MSEETIEQARARAAHNAKAQEWWGNGNDVAWAPQPNEPKALMQGIAAWGVGWFYPASPDLTPELYFWQGGWAWLRDDGRLTRNERWTTVLDVKAWVEQVAGTAGKGRVIWAQEGRKP